MTSPVYNAADLLLLFEVVGLRVQLSGDARHIVVSGPRVVLEAARPKLTQQRATLIAELQRRAVRAADGRSNPDVGSAA